METNRIRERVGKRDCRFREYGSAPWKYCNNHGECEY